VSNTIQVGGKTIGDGEPTFVIAEIGINHNGSLELAKQLIDSAVAAGCDAVKFQKRNPDICVPEDQKSVIRETPWGRITYLDYRYRIEFGDEEFGDIDKYCKEKNILWFSSCWDKDSVDFMEQFDPPCYKISSACSLDRELLSYTRSKKRPILLSTGMVTMEQIKSCLDFIKKDDLVLLHSTSSYPCAYEELNLKVIPALKSETDCLVGYSGHEVGLMTTVVAVCLGATVVERHITMDRAMWGSDQAASVEPHGLIRLVSQIRQAEIAVGDGIKCVYPSEQKAISKLRRVATL
jgi:N-acetylneuraminate synthase